MISVRPKPGLEGQVTGPIKAQCRRLWMHRLKYLLCIPIAAMLVVGSSTAAYAELCTTTGGCHTYAGQTSRGTGVSGTDGYLYATPSVGMSSSQGLAWWLGVTSTSGSTQTWTQTGKYQGTVWKFLQPGQGSLTAMRQYWEAQSSCAYQGGDLGYSASNLAFYVTIATTSHNGGPCEGAEFWTYVRVASFSNPPVAVGHVPAITFGPDAALEKFAYANTLIPGAYPGYFGYDNSHQIDPAHSLHVLFGSSWPAWTSSQVPYTYAYNNAPPYYHSSGSFAQFYSADS